MASVVGDNGIVSAIIGIIISASLFPHLAHISIYHTRYLNANLQIQMQDLQMNQSRYTEDHNFHQMMRFKSIQTAFKLSILSMIAYTLYSAFLSMSSSRLIFIAAHLDCHSQAIIAKIWFISTTTTYYMVTCQTYITLAIFDYKKRVIYFKRCLIGLFTFQLIVITVIICHSIQNYDAAKMDLKITTENFYKYFFSCNDTSSGWISAAQIMFDILFGLVSTCLFATELIKMARIGAFEDPIKSQILRTARRATYAAILHFIGQRLMLLCTILFQFDELWMQLYCICAMYSIMIIHGNVPNRFGCATLCHNMERRCISTRIMLRIYQCCSCIRCGSRNVRVRSYDIEITPPPSNGNVDIVYIEDWDEI